MWFHYLYYLRPFQTKNTCVGRQFIDACEATGVIFMLSLGWHSATSSSTPKAPLDLLAALAEWLLGLGCVDAAQADFLGLAALRGEAAQSVAIAHPNDVAGKGLFAG